MGMRMTIIATCLGIALGSCDAMAQRSGVLIGVAAPPAENPYSAGSDISTARYETWWIVSDAQRPLRGVVPDLLVPRQTGFWRVGIAATCAFDTGSQNQTEHDVVWTTPLGKVATVATDSLCNSPDTTSQYTMCGHNTARFSFVSGEFIGTWRTAGQSEECEPRGFRWRDYVNVRRFGSDSAVSLDAIVGTRAAHAVVAAITGKGHTEPGYNCPELTPHDFTADWLENWTVEWQRGRWVPIAFYQPWASAECQFETRLSLQLPRALGGAQMLHPSWAAIRRAVPNVVEATTSPTADLVVAVTRDSLVALEANGTVVGGRLLARALPYPYLRDRVVMVEWAVGAHVARWDSIVRSISAAESPVRVIPRD